MRTSRSEAGFTLVEILVVVFIIATVMSIGMLSFGVIGDDRELQTEAKRFAALFQVAQEEAIMQGREYGIEVMTTGYRFVEFDTALGIWVDIPNDELFRQRVLPEPLEFDLYLEDKRIKLELDPGELEDPEKEKTRFDTKVYAPHLIIFSSGDATPFEVHVWRQFDDRRVILQGNTLGSLEFDNTDDG